MMEQMLGLIDTDLSRERITILIWAHSYRALQKTPGSVLFVVTRTLERENFFNGLAQSRRQKMLLDHNTNRSSSIHFAMPNEL